MNQPLYDIQNDWLKLFRPPAFGMGMVVLCCLFIRYKRYLRPQSHKFVPYVAIVVISVVTAIGTIANILHWSALVRALKNGDCRTVEGEVKSFHPRSVTPENAPESFCVADVCFSYIARDLTPHFNLTKAEGSPLENGVYVKVWYSGRDILRLEIARAEDK